MKQEIKTLGFHIPSFILQRNAVHALCPVSGAGSRGILAQGVVAELAGSEPLLGLDGIAVAPAMGADQRKSLTELAESLRSRPAAQ
ncbi:MAG: hypothetical protein V4726_21845 [Verrucomicrobiota bacterium]